MNPDFWLTERKIPLQATYLTLLAVHGNLCLALRHPQNRGPGRAHVVAFTQSLGQWLVNAGVLTPEQLVEAQQLEAAEGSGDLL
jgi:hypothetical protein